MEKQCAMCEKVKSVEMFGRSVTGALQRNNNCKACCDDMRKTGYWAGNNIKKKRLGAVAAEWMGIRYSKYY